MTLTAISGFVIFGLFFVRFLAVVRFPGAFRHLKIGEHGRETGIFRAAGINTEADRAGTFPYMADTHLGEVFTVLGTFDALVVFTAAEAVPHDFDVSRDGGGCPVGIAVIGRYRAKMLEGFVFVFNGTFQPVL